MAKRQSSRPSRAKVPSRPVPPSLATLSPRALERKRESRAEDLRLIHAALEGEQLAFKRLMAKYYPQLHNLIARLIRNSEEVNDLTQEAFVKAFHSLKYFNEEFAFSTWLYKIATNNTIDHIRRRKLDTFSIDKPISSEESDFSFELPDTTHQPDKDLIFRQRSALLQEAIAQLPEKYRRVIVMRHNEERDYAEIARMLKLPIGTVKAHIFRARELLYKYLRSKIKHY